MNYIDVLTEAKKFSPGLCQTMAVLFYKNHLQYVINLAADESRRQKAAEKLHVVNDLYSAIYERRN